MNTRNNDIRQEAVNNFLETKESLKAVQCEDGTHQVINGMLETVATGSLDYCQQWIDVAAFEYAIRFYERRLSNNLPKATQAIQNEIKELLEYQYGWVQKHPEGTLAEVCAETVLMAAMEKDGTH